MPLSKTVTATRVACRASGEGQKCRKYIGFHRFELKRVEAADIKSGNLRAGPLARGKSVGNVLIGFKRVEAADVKRGNLRELP